MERLSDVVRGRSICRCPNCKYCDRNGFCWKLAADVKWYIANDKQPRECPKIFKKGV